MEHSIYTIDNVEKWNRIQSYKRNKTVDKILQSKENEILGYIISLEEELKSQNTAVSLGKEIRREKPFLKWFFSYVGIIKNNIKKE